MLLKEVIDFYMDYEIKNDVNLEIQEKLDKIQQKKIVLLKNQRN